ncbi:MAG TPA: PP2C family protein-serine/threonine phosphatase [Terriglobales bacterium]|nr:PP2C family protein-serine/threonine phosphatase [Terriglobales bacterium]
MQNDSGLRIDEYLRRRLMPVEGAIPQLSGIEMYGNSIPAGSVGGDVYEYINFQQRYNIEGRIARARRLAKEYLEPTAPGAKPRNEVDLHAQWMASKPNYTAADIDQYRKAKSSEQVRIAENLRGLYTTAGVLLVDAQGHGIIAAKIASTVHDTFHAFMLSELDRNGTITPDLFEQLNLRLAQSVTARNALGRDENAEAREIATLLYGELQPNGQFRFVNFGHPPPLVFSVKYNRFMEIDRDRMVQFLALGLEIPEDHPDKNKYVSVKVRRRRIDASDVAEITLMGKGDILFLYTDGVYDGSDNREEQKLENIIREYKQNTAKEICDAVLEYAVQRDARLRQENRNDEIDDKTVFMIRRT